MHWLGGGDSPDFLSRPVLYNDRVGRNIRIVNAAQTDNIKQAVLLNILNHKAHLVGVGV